MKWFILILLLYLFSCDSYNEKEQLIANEAKVKLEAYKGFSEKETKLIKRVEFYLPTKSKVTYMDKNEFIYFKLGKKIFTIKWAGYYVSPIVYEIK